MARNIVIIGMPGSGKTSFGEGLARAIGYNFIDMDDFLVDMAGRSIEDMFEEGEPVFREQECLAARKLSEKENTVIATGGGVVKTPASMYALKRTGVTIFLDRPVKNIEEDIHRESRPLLKDGSSRIQEVYDERISLYKDYADYHFENKGSEPEVLDRLVRLVKEEL